MKRIFAIAALALLVFGLAGCVSGPSQATAAAAGIQEKAGILVQNAFTYMHVDGHKDERETVAYVLFEYELLKKVKYQVAYIACTCRGPEVNFYSVAYVELSKEDGSILELSYDKDSTGHYTPGMYGDSYITWEGVEAKELFDGFIRERLIGKAQDTVNAIEPMHGEVDAFTGATVTPNNAVRMLQGLFAYHNAKYMH